MVDVFTTSASSSLSALAVGSLAYWVRKKYIRRKFYRMTDDELARNLAVDILPDYGDKAIIEGVDKIPFLDYNDNKLPKTVASRDKRD